jgi:hypothetical protein
MNVRPKIIGEYQSYKQEIQKHNNGNTVKTEPSELYVTDNITIDFWHCGGAGVSQQILRGSHVDDNPYTPDEIKKNYVFSGMTTGPIKDVEIQYVEQNEGGREVITKKSTDILKHEVLSWEKVDAFSGEVMEEWFIPDHKNRI